MATLASSRSQSTPASAMSSYDVQLLFLLRFIRVCAYGGSTLILSLFLSSLGNSDSKIGIFMSATLVGDLIVSVLTSLIADSLGRRRMLAFGSILMALSGIIFATCDNFWVLLTASIFGVISPSGGDIGPFKAIEESTLAHLLPAESLNASLAWYYTLGSWGGALGLLATGWLIQCLQSNKMAALDAYRVAFGLYSAIGVLKTVVTFLLTDKCEAEPQDPASSEAIQPRSMNESEPLLPPHRRSTTPAFSISLPTRGFLLKFCPIIMFDNVGTGFSTDSWLTYFLNRKFPNISDGLLGSIFSTCSVIISISNILAIPAARRFGILHTMIMGHVIASTALMLLPLPDELNGAVMLLVTRAVFLDFDQAPRQTFLSQRLPADERTAAMGFVNMTRTLAQSGGPLLTGYLGQQGQLGFSFVLAGVVKLVYDILLAVVFLPESCKQ